MVMQCSCRQDFRLHDYNFYMLVECSSGVCECMCADETRVQKMDQQEEERRQKNHQSSATIFFPSTEMNKE
jgi:hypothetical protein